MQVNNIQNYNNISFKASIKNGEYYNWLYSFTKESEGEKGLKIINNTIDRLKNFSDDSELILDCPKVMFCNKPVYGFRDELMFLENPKTKKTIFVNSDPYICEFTFCDEAAHSSVSKNGCYTYNDSYAVIFSKLVDAAINWKNFWCR